MKVAFAAALLLGLVAARTKLMGYDNTRVITGSNGIFDISYSYDFEATYGTKYNTEVDAATFT